MLQAELGYFLGHRVIWCPLPQAHCFLSSRRRHTRLQGDWSSDVCSSDLASLSAAQLRARAAADVAHVVRWRSRLLRGVAEDAEVAGRRQPALIGVEHVQPGGQV